MDKQVCWIRLNPHKLTTSPLKISTKVHPPVAKGGNWVQKTFYRYRLHGCDAEIKTLYPATHRCAFCNVKAKCDTETNATTPVTLLLSRCLSFYRIPSSHQETPMRARDSYCPVQENALPRATGATRLQWRIAGSSDNKIQKLIWFTIT